jgi:hypothetical protein
VDLTDASQSPTRTLEVGPGAGLDGTGLLVLVGEPGTAFFTGALPSDTAPFAFDLGDACETTMPNETDFPIAILALEEPVDQAVYACSLNQVTGRVWVNYIGAEGEDTLAPTAAPTLTSTLAPVRELIPGLFGEN